MKTYKVYIYLKNGTEIITDAIHNATIDMHLLCDMFEEFRYVTIGNVLMATDTISHIIYREEK